MVTIPSIYLRIKKYLINTSWIISEKVISAIISIFITAIVARYLGPEKFGLISYAISVTAIFSAASQLGLAGLIVREFVKKPDQANIILGTTFLLKIFSTTIIWSILIIYSCLVEQIGSTDFWILIIVSISLFFSPINVIQYWFQSQLKDQYTAIAGIGSTILAGSYKILLVSLGASIFMFAFSSILQASIFALLLVFFYIWTNRPLPRWSFKTQQAMDLLRQSWAIYLGSIFAVIYFKIDLVMLKWYIGSDAAGEYAAAAKLSEAWYFIPAAIVASLFPKLIKLHSNNRKLFDHRLQQIFDLLFLISAAAAITTSATAKPLIGFIFGEAYGNAAPILLIHIWGAIFIFMRAAFSKWILIEDVLIFSLVTQGCGALANILLNVILIPYYGGIGAAIATIISYALSSYGALFFHNKTRPICFMMTKAIFSPIRYLVLWRPSKIFG